MISPYEENPCRPLKRTWFIYCCLPRHCRGGLSRAAASRLERNLYHRLLTLLLVQALGGAGYFSARVLRASATTASAVKPKYLSKSFIGAEAPKRCMPIIFPFGPT